MDDGLRGEDLHQVLVELPLRNRKRRRPGSSGPPVDGGRDPLFADDAVRSRILTFTRAGAPKVVAARSAGVARPTFFRWLQRGREGEEPYATFLEEVEVAEAFAEVRLVGLFSAAAEHDYRAARDLLRVRFPQRWNVDRIEADSVIEAEELIEPRDDIEQLSEVMAAYEEAGLTPGQAQGQ